MKMDLQIGIAVVAPFILFFLVFKIPRGSVTIAKYRRHSRAGKVYCPSYACVASSPCLMFA